MRKNKIKQMMKDGKPVINGWCAIPSTASAEAMAHQGWDSLTIDMQHGLVDYSNALPMLQTISTTDVTPLARVNWNEPGQIMKILDAGCYGIVCPMVSNRKEAENFVQACMYPPDGYRRRWSSSGQWLVPGEGGDHPQAVGGLIHGDHVAGFWGGCRGLEQGEGVRCQRRC